MPNPARPASRRETAVSFAVIGGLVLTAAGVLLRQSSFNPAVTETLKAAGMDATAESSAAGPFAVSLPQGLIAMSEPESFDRETLSDKIDGRAELYLSAGFVKLDTLRVRLADDRETWFEIFVYDMGGQRNAFSVFSTQRREGALALKFVRNGYRTGNGACFVGGRSYFEIIASRTGDKALAAVEALGRMLTADGKIAGSDDDMTESGLFPEKGRIPGSIQLITANAFSFGRFDNIFAARYRSGGDTATLFISRRSSAREASELADAYHGFLVDLDGREESAGAKQSLASASFADGAGAWLVNMDGSFEGAFASGRLLAGVHQASSAAIARDSLELLRNALKGQAP
jgi:hypothetical protein